MKKLLNKKLAMVLTTFVLLSQPVFGQAVFGGSDCGQWANRRDSAISKTAAELWLAGYMSGINSMYVTYSKRADALNKVDSLEQMVLWMDNYCNKNPLSNISIGGFELFRELELMKR